MSVLPYFDVSKFSSYLDRYFLQNSIISKDTDNWKSEIFWNLGQNPVFFKKVKSSKWYLWKIDHLCHFYSI